MEAMARAVGLGYSLRLIIGGDQQDLAISNQLAQSNCEFKTVHSRHANVGKQNFGGYEFGERKCRFAVIGRCSPVSPGANNLRQGVGHQPVVVHNEDVRRGSTVVRAESFVIELGPGNGGKMRHGNPTFPTVSGCGRYGLTLYVICKEAAMFG